MEMFIFDPILTGKDLLSSLCESSKSEAWREFVYRSVMEGSRSDLLQASRCLIFYCQLPINLSLKLQVLTRHTNRQWIINNNIIISDK